MDVRKPVFMLKGRTTPNVVQQIYKKS